MTLARRALQYLGVRAARPPNIILTERAPTSNDKAYVKGDIWVDIPDLASYQYGGGGDWIALGTGAVGGIVTIDGDTGTATPAGGVVNIIGTSADGLSFAGATDTLTGSIAASSTTQRGSVELATNAETVTGTDAVRAVTPAGLTARLAAPGAIGGTTPAAGAFTTVTASGDITTTAGNVVISGAAKQLQVEGGAVTDFIGTATLTAGTSGAIANTNIAAGDRIFIQRTAANASTTLGELSYTISAGASFTINSLIVGTPGSVETGDASSVTYFIVRQL